MVCLFRSKSKSICLFFRNNIDFSFELLKDYFFVFLYLILSFSKRFCIKLFEMEKYLEFLKFVFYFLVFIVIGLKLESYTLVS